MLYSVSDGTGGRALVSLVCCLGVAGTHQGQQRCLVPVCFPPAEDTDLGHTHSCSVLSLWGQVSLSCCQLFASLNSKPKLCWVVEFFGYLAGDIVSGESYEGGKRSEKYHPWLGGRRPNWSCLYHVTIRTLTNISITHLLKNGIKLSLRACWGHWAGLGTVFKSTWALWYKKLPAHKQTWLFIISLLFLNEARFWLLAESHFSPLGLSASIIRRASLSLPPSWQTSSSSNNIYWPALCIGHTTGSLDCKPSEHRLFLTPCSARQLKISNQE